MSEPSLSLLERREIEARVLGPFLRELEAEIGRERTLALARKVIENLAKSAGADSARTRRNHVASLRRRGRPLERKQRA